MIKYNVLTETDVACSLRKVKILEGCVKIIDGHD